MFLMPLSRSRYVSPAERLFDNFFSDALMGMGQYERPDMVANERPYWLTSRQDPSAFSGTFGKVQDEKDKFAVSVDVQHFAPNEIKVTTSGHQLVIEGKHEEKSDEHGQIERHFIRKYLLPKDVSVDQVVSHLSKDGVLTVSAPKNAIEGPAVRNVAIQPAPEQTKPIEEAKTH